MRVLVSGSHGLIGRALATKLTDSGHVVVGLVRGPVQAGEVRWDPAAGTMDASALEGFDAVVHLAGAPIGEHRWDEKQKDTIRRSRVEATALLARTLAELAHPPVVMASGSAVGFYGDRGDEVLTESSARGQGFLADVVADWESAAQPAVAAGIRVAFVRTGVVLADQGGALARMLPIFKVGIGGRLGSGRQYFSWISLADEVAAIIHLLQSVDLVGPVNLTAPNPVTNSAFTAALGRAVHRPAFMPVPTIGLNLAFGAEMTAEMLIGGQRVEPAALLASGFKFSHPTIDEALRSVLAR